MIVVSVADDNSEIGYGSIDGDRLQHDSRPASEFTSQQPDQCDQSHVVVSCMCLSHRYS